MREGVDLVYNTVEGGLDVFQGGGDGNAGHAEQDADFQQGCLLGPTLLLQPPGHQPQAALYGLYDSLSQHIQLGLQPIPRICR